MDKHQAITRVIELIYMSKGVSEGSLSGASGDAMHIAEVLEMGSTTSTVSTILDLALMDRFGAHDTDSTWDDAELLEFLVGSL